MPLVAAQQQMLGVGTGPSENRIVSARKARNAA